MLASELAHFHRSPARRCRGDVTQLTREIHFSVQVLDLRCQTQLEQIEAAVGTMEKVRERNLGRATRIDNEES